MNIAVTGLHIDVTPPIREYAEEKVRRMPKFFDGIQKVQVTLDVENTEHIAEIILHVSGGGVLVAESRAEDLYAAIDRADAKMERQLRKHKTRLRRRRRTGAAP